MYFDPNIGLVTQNYLETKARLLGIGNYTEEGFASMEKALGMKDEGDSPPVGPRTRG